MRRRRLIATYDRLPIEAQSLLVDMAGDLWRATLRRATAAQTTVEAAPAPPADADRELLLAAIRHAHSTGQHDRKDRA